LTQQQTQVEPLLVGDLVRWEALPAGAIEVRSESERVVAVRFAKWGDIGRTANGNERFDSGAFDHDPLTGANDPANVILRMEHEGPPAGRGITMERTEEGQTGLFQVAPTARGDELLTLAREGYYRGASPSFEEIEGGTAYEGRGAQRIIARKKVNLREVSLTWRPTYEGTAVIYARSAPEAEGTMTEQTVTDSTPEQAPIVAGQLVSLEQRVSGIEAKGMTTEDLRVQHERLQERLAALEQRSAERPTVSTGASVPAMADVPKPFRGDWVQAALKMMDGGQLSSLEQRALADIISPANVGMVPPAYVGEMVGAISTARPFMASTRQIQMPDNGTQIIYPRILTRPTVAEQATQKSEVSSTAVTTDTQTANVRTFAGAGDISLQLLRRSSPAFLDFYLQLLAEAYAKGTNAAALAALTAAGVLAGGTFDPDTGVIDLGAAFANSVTSIGAPPNTAWLSSAAVAGMINARDSMGRPLYGAGGLYAPLGDASAGAGTSGSFSGMRPIWEPALDAGAIDVLIGPSNGFAWAEDGTFTLEADVPGRLGRDVALAGFVAFLPLYPAAFTSYALVP
jgi:HK97 family phage major capsid protein